MCQQYEFEANFPGNLDRHINMQQKMMRIIWNNFKALPEPPIEKDDNNVYNFKCEKGDTKYRSLVILRIHQTKQHTEVLEVRSSVSNVNLKPNIPVT